jgi:hypothetical protein
MVAPALIAGMAQGVGGLLGGRSRKKAAKRAEKIARQQGEEVAAANRADQERAIQYRDADQAALRAEGVGYDFAKLRADAQAAGFNPLTILGATGGAGYDRASTVLSTPFIGTSEAMMARADLITGGATNRISTSGYVGDSIMSAASGYFQQKNADDLMKLDYARLAQERALAGRSAFGASGVGYNAGYGTGATVGGIFDQDTPSGDKSSWFSRMVSMGREIIAQPLEDIPGFIRVQNGFGVTYVPGSGGDPWDTGEDLTVLGSTLLEHPVAVWNVIGGLNPDGSMVEGRTGLAKALTYDLSVPWNLMGGLNADGTAVEGRTGLWGWFTTPFW